MSNFLSCSTSIHSSTLLFRDITFSVPILSLLSLLLLFFHVRRSPSVVLVAGGRLSVVTVRWVPRLGVLLKAFVFIKDTGLLTQTYQFVSSCFRCYFYPTS
uniref:Transmembrane protein n=1 Tax=Cacopsylla melanoneura TaxID=428564 RepID=A0A8D8M185_9HEMI